MQKFSLLFIILLLLCAPLFAQNIYNSQEKLEYIVQQLPELQSIKCKFKQEKYLQNIQKPVVSSGNFEFKKGEGVYFHTTYPIKSETDYTNQNYRQINDVINAISNKRYAKLEKEFNFFFSGQSNNWTFGIKPKNFSRSFEYISHITVSGSDYIKYIEIKQTNGNKTVIWFTK